MRNQKIVDVLDRLIFWCLCPLFYFLPISNALVEIFSSFAIIFYLVKRGLVVSANGFGAGPARYFWDRSRFLRYLYPPVIWNSPLRIPLLIFVLLNLVSVFFSQEMTLSWKGFFFKLIEQVLIFFACAESVRTPRRVIAVTLIFAFIGTLMGLDGIFQYWTGKDFIHGHAMVDAGRAQGPFRQANDFGTFLVFVVFLLVGLTVISNKSLLRRRDNSAGFWFKINPSWLRVILGAGLLCILISMGLTYSRGVWVGFLFSSVFWAAIKKGKAALVILGISIFFSFVFFPYLYKIRPITKFQHNVYSQCSNTGFVPPNLIADSTAQEKPAGDLPVLQNTQQESAGDAFPIVQTVLIVPQYALGNPQGRFDYWREALNIIKDYPWFGIGINTYSVVGPKYKISWGGYPHNCYLQMAAEIGIPGLLAFLWLIFVFYSESLRLWRILPNGFYKVLMEGFLAAIFAFLVHGFFDTNFYSVRLAILPWIGMGLVMALPHIAETKQRES